MAENYELAYIDYKNGMKYKEIAEKYGVTLNTVKSWKTRKWNKDDNEKGVHTKQKSVHTKRISAKPIKKAVESEEVIIFDVEGEDGFTDKQRLFIAYYVKCWNATKAYRKAYQCDYTTANVNGPRLLGNASIREEIIRVRDGLTDDALLDKRTLIQKWIDIAFADITDYVQFGTETIKDLDDMGNPVEYKVNYTHLSDSTELDGTLITEVKKGKDGITIKLADKMKALEYLSKHMDLLNENEMKQLKLERERIAIRKENGEENVEHEDDGFFEALGATATEVWRDEDD